MPRFNHNPDHLVDIRALSAYTLIEARRNIFRQSLDVESTTGRRLVDLETLVSNLPTQQISDPQDTIYALLSISSDAQPHTFEVDYNENSTQVFKDFIQFCVNRSKSIDVICRHWAPEPVRSKGSSERQSRAPVVQIFQTGRRFASILGTQSIWLVFWGTRTESVRSKQ